MAGTTIRPDKATAKLVTDGPFRFSRNPLYLALTLMYAGFALIANSVWALFLLLPVILIMSRFVIRREEEYLARTFGEERCALQDERPTVDLIQFCRAASPHCAIGLRDPIRFTWSFSGLPVPASVTLLALSLD